MSTAGEKRTFVCSAAPRAWTCGVSLCTAFVAFVLDALLYVTNTVPWPWSGIGLAAAIPGIVLMVSLMVERFGYTTRTAELRFEPQALSWSKRTVMTADVVSWDGLSVGSADIAVLTTRSGRTWWFVTTDGGTALALRGWLSSASQAGHLRFEKGGIGSLLPHVAVTSPILAALPLLLLPVSEGGLHDVAAFYLVFVATWAVPILAALCTQVVLVARLIHTLHVGWSYISNWSTVPLQKARFRASSAMVRQALLRSGHPAISSPPQTGKRGHVFVQADGVTVGGCLARVFGPAARRIDGIDEAALVSRIIEHRIEAVQRRQEGTFR